MFMYNAYVVELNLVTDVIRVQVNACHLVVRSESLF
jgi:hypothetical protein